MAIDLGGTLARAMGNFSFAGAGPLPLWQRIAVCIPAAYFIYEDSMLLVSGRYPNTLFFFLYLANLLAWVIALASVAMERIREYAYIMAFMTGMFAITLGIVLSNIIWAACATDDLPRILTTWQVWLNLAGLIAVPLVLSGNRRGTAWVIGVLGVISMIAFLIYRWAPNPITGWVVGLLVAGFVLIPYQTIAVVRVFVTAFLAIVAAASIGSYNTVWRK